MKRLKIFSGKIEVIGFIFFLLASSLVHESFDNANASTVSPSVPSRQFTLKADPQFSREQLSGNVRVWYDRLWAAIKHPKQYPNSTNLAGGINGEKGGTYDYGRPLNLYITSILTVFRATGDLALLDEVDRVTQIMRSKLSDWALDSMGKKAGTLIVRDKYLNWVYLHPRDPKWNMGDYHKMDDILTHSLIAEVAYAFKANGNLNPRYAERALFWRNYLVNHFEKKWRGRKNISSGPFMDKALTHAFIQWIRYYYYMHLLTGQDWYRVEAIRKSEVIKKQMIEVENGTAYVWDHRTTMQNGKRSLMCQPFIYARYTVQAALDLALEGFSVFNYSFMEKIAGTVKMLFIDKKLREFSPDVCGGRGLAGLPASGYRREKPDRWGISPFTELGGWDTTGSIVKASMELFSELEGDPESPRRIFIPAGIVFSELFWKRAQHVY